MQVRHLGGAQVTAGQTRMLDDDGVRQPAFLFPFAHQQLHAARVRQDRDQRGGRKVTRDLGQVQRQSGADDDGVCAAGQRLPHIGLVGAQGLHHVDGDQAVAAGDLAGALDLAVQRQQVGGVNQLARMGFLVQVAGLRHQVGVAPPQVHRGDGADAAQPRHRTGQPAGRHAHAHAALHHRQQLAPGQPQGPQPGVQRQTLEIYRQFTEK